MSSENETQDSLIETELEDLDWEEDGVWGPVEEKTLEEIEEEFDFAFRHSLSRAAATFMLFLIPVAIIVLLYRQAELGQAILTIVGIISVIFLIMMTLNKLFRRNPDQTKNSNFRYRFVWAFSNFVNGLKGDIFGVLPHKRIEHLFIRRNKFLEAQGKPGFLPGNKLSDQRLEVFGKLTLEKLPLFVMRAARLIGLLLLALMEMAGAWAIVDFVWKEWFR